MNSEWNPLQTFVSLLSWGRLRSGIYLGPKLLLLSLSSNTYNSLCREFRLIVTWSSSKRDKVCSLRMLKALHSCRFSSYFQYILRSSTSVQLSSTFATLFREITGAWVERRFPVPVFIAFASRPQRRGYPIGFSGSGNRHFWDSGIGNR